MVEFGCGYGLFTIPAAQAVSGTVYALDIEPELVAETIRRGTTAGLPNVVAEVRDFVTDGCGRPDGTAGYAMLFNILHIENPVGLLREAYRALVPAWESPAELTDHCDIATLAAAAPPCPRDSTSTCFTTPSAPARVYVFTPAGRIGKPSGVMPHTPMRAASSPI